MPDYTNEELTLLLATREVNFVTDYTTKDTSSMRMPEDASNTQPEEEKPVVSTPCSVIADCHD